MDESTPLVYLVFGAPNSGRREVIFDLIDGGIQKDQQVLYFRPNEEAACPHDEQIEALENVSVVDWQLKDCKVTHGQITAAPEKIIFIASGTADPADCAEALKAWTDHNNCKIARLLTVVNCGLLKAQPQTQAWFDACIHFSDIVLLNRREGVDNKWIKDVETAHKKAHNPARILLVKKGRVSNPAEVLDPEPRRLSLYFDELIPIEDDEFEDEHQPDDLKPDRYIERLENGQRAKPVQDISQFL